MVGTFEGDSVGLTDGLSVGAEDGLYEGEFVAIGLSVGFVVGTNEG